MAEKRKYDQKRRAEHQEVTRRRITEATVALHQEIGPAQTTISAIAERAGVERLTVYRHFPSDSDLLRACQQHFRAQHPEPNMAAWAALSDPADRLRAALSALYAYYRETEQMTAHVLHDAPLMPALAELVTGPAAYFAALHTHLAAGWDVAGNARVELEAAIGHALDFETWRSLARRHGLTDGQAVHIMVRLVTCLASPNA